MDKYYEVFRQALAERGWIQGKNVAFEYRSARGSPPQFGEPATLPSPRSVLGRKR